MKMPNSPPSFDELMKAVLQDPERARKVLAMGLSATHRGKYLHWDKLRHLMPPSDLTHEEWWCATKLARRPVSLLPLADVSGEPFGFLMAEPVQKLVHEIDRDAAGRIEMAEQVANPNIRDRYVVSSLMEEAITSSQLEGAATTRRVAKDMLRSGRPPRDHGEQMILNNYAAIRHIRDVQDLPLTPELVIELQRLLTSGTLENPDAVGRLRHSEEKIDVATYYNEVLHIPPPADQLPYRLKLMCDFANRRTPKSFVHPVVRAVILHFWLAYEHPFVDGNGRTARALFYWSMLNQGYWLCEFLSISHIIRKAPAKYEKAFLHTETDGNDLTYFVLYHLEIVHKAIQELYAYLKQKMRQLRDAEGLLRRTIELNHRQIALLSHALRHPDARYTIRSHGNSHNVTYQTARTDLQKLASKGLLDQRLIGQTFHFSPAKDLPDVLRDQD